MTIQELASNASQYMTTGTRDNGETFYKMTDDRPEWFSDMVRKAHGEMMPDDYIYRWVSYALDAFQNYDDPEDALCEIQPDVYNYDLLQWVSSNLWRMAYVDDAMDNGAKTLADALMWGQSEEMREVYDCVLNSLQAQLEEV